MIGNPYRPTQAESGCGGQASIAMSPKASTRLLATQSDERLAALVRAGHDRAFEALVLRHRAPLLRYCRRVPLSESRAEDVVQQALLRAWTALRRGAEVRDLRAWLYRIAHNTAIDVVRDAAREGQRVTAEPDGSAPAPAGRSIAAPAAGAADTDLERGLAAKEALVSIAALPQMQREVVFRTAIAGYSHEEVASALGLSDGAVRGLLYRARVALRATITALTPPPLLTWMAGAGQGPAGERIGELAAGGGSIGLGGLLFKGGLAALTAGTLLTGAVIVHPSARHPARGGASRSPRELASAAAPQSHGAALGWASSNASSGGPSSASASLRPARGATGRHSSSGTPTARGWTVGGPVPPAGAQAPRFGSLRRGTRAPSSSGPSSGGGAGPGQNAPSAQSPAPTAGSGGGGSSEGSGSGAAGASSGGSSGGSGSAGGGSGSGGAGTGSGGSGTGSGGGGAGGSGGSTGGSSGGGGSPPPPSGSGGSGGSGGGSGGAGGTEGGSGGSGGSGGAGGGSGSGGPVTTVVHEVTNLLESTVHGVLGGH